MKMLITSTTGFVDSVLQKKITLNETCKSIKKIEPSKEVLGLISRDAFNKAEYIPKRKMIFLLNDAKFLLSHRLEFSIAMRDEGYEMHIICACKEKETISYLESEGFYFHQLPITRSGLNPFGELRAILNIYRLFKQIKPDLSYMVSIKAVIYGGLISRILKVPSVLITISGLGYVFISKTLKAKFFQKIALSLYKIVFKHKNIKVIFQNPDDKSYFLSLNLLDKSKALLIKGVGVDLEKFYPEKNEPEGKICVSMVSRLLRDKGVREFIEAAKIIKSQNHNIIMQLVGDIDPQNPASLTQSELENLIAEEVVIWKGYSDDIANIYRKSHIACLPSYREGLPKSLMEALACGLPIITTDVPGCREIICEEIDGVGINGIIVPVQNGEAIAEAIIKLANQPVLRQSMRASSRIIAENEYDVHKITAEILKIANNLTTVNYTKSEVK
jgi:glycosyltransferase involved in cell wall biosynthesis